MFSKPCPPKLASTKSALLTALLSWLLMMPPVFAARPAAATEELEEHLLLQKKKIERVRQGISDHKIRIKESKEKEIDLLDELEKIDRKIIDAGLKLVELGEEVKTQEKLTREKEEFLARVKEEKLNLQKHMEKRLAAYYRLGDIGFLNVVFSAESLPELLKFKEYFHHMLRDDRRLFSEFKEKIKELEKARQIYLEEKEILLKAIDREKTQQRELDKNREARRQLLIRVSTEKKLYQRAIGEMEKAARALTRTIAELEEKFAEVREQKELKQIKEFPLEPFKKRKPSASRNFSAQRGRLSPPVQGKISKRFGKSSDEKFGTATSADGIEIQAEPGAEIRAIFAGKVVYADFLRGYGKLIIIDHGGQYYSLLGGLGEIKQKVGNRVKKGEIIGTASNHLGLLSQGMHMEIRHSTTPEDPLEWLDPKEIVFAEGI